jgi:hypothetical protein
MLPDFSFAAWRPLLPGISFWALAFYLPLCLPLARLEEGLAAGSLNGPLREGLLLVTGVALALLVGLLSDLVLGLALGPGWASSLGLVTALWSLFWSLANRRGAD